MAPLVDMQLRLDLIPEAALLLWLWGVIVGLTQAVGRFDLVGRLFPLDPLFLQEPCWRGWLATPMLPCGSAEAPG